MSDGMPGTRAPVIAIGAAVVALMTSLIAVIVVVTRSPSTEKRDTDPLESRVAAAELVKLKRDSVESVSEAGNVIGVKVTDDKIRVALGLAPTDVLTNFAGRAIKREFDVYDAILGASLMDISIVHVELLRDGKPVHLRWQLDGDLRAARRSGDTTGVRPRTTDPFGGLPTRDPLIDTIKKLDDLHYELPRSTLEQVATNPGDYSRGARVVPSMRGGIMDGFKLYAIRPSSMFAAVGLQNGDTVRAINGYETDTIEKLQEIYPKIKDAKELAIDITRRGSYELITITIK
jgi:S1-C subfamily serine protease